MLSRLILRCRKRAQSIQLPRITYILAQGQFQTPSELRARSIWSSRVDKSVDFTVNQMGWRSCASDKSFKNHHVFIAYLGAQASDRAHVLQFWSTHQYYRTVKYQLHRTHGGGDIKQSVFRIRQNPSGLGGLSHSLKLTGCTHLEWRNQDCWLSPSLLVRWSWYFTVR